MPTIASVENNFTKGLVTEFTGLNFPENAATDCDNVVFDIIGNVTRREGFDYESNFTQTTIDRTARALSTYKWNNAGGDGSTQVLVQQVGSTLHFYKSSAATLSVPLSSQKLASTVDLTAFVPAGGSFTISKEATYADGNGYLFVFHPDMDPIYCTYVGGTIVGNVIDIKIRDFVGVVDGLEDSFRPPTLSDAHKYNLFNQGWFAGTAWTGVGTSPADNLTVATHTWTIQTGLTISAGQVFAGTATTGGFPHSNTFTFVGTVTSYNSGTGSLVFAITSTTNSSAAALVWVFTFVATATGFVDTFFTAAGSKYPSNVDIWWAFKNASDAFDPGTTLSHVSQFAGPAPKGRYILSTFNKNRTSISTIPNLTTVSTLVRPRIGAWHAGRVWYSGVDASFAATGTAQDTSWSETIYFSQIIVKSEQLGRCYQVNDPTSQDFFDLLPTDGGTVVIQGCGQIFKLFSVQNGLLVFAANGIWFITGSQGIGFAANDYTITKISGIEATNTDSFISVFGWPIFWNVEGIYTVQPSDKGGGLEVNNLCLGTILTYYQNIPVISKKYARGDFDPINYIVEWCFRSTNETSSTDRYEFDKILNFNLHTKAFYPYSLAGTPKIHGINYIQSPGGSTAPEPIFKYLTSTLVTGAYKFTFSEEKDITNYKDWFTRDSVGIDYSSYFITGYKLHGQAQRKFQPNYMYLYSNNAVNTRYQVQGIWDYAISSNSHRFSSPETAYNTTSTSNYSKLFKRHRIRGHGYILQFKVLSLTGYPFDIQGWSVQEIQNQGP